MKLMNYRKRVTTIVHNQGRFLVCKPNAEANYWTLPGGGIDRGETVEQAGLRECLEEAGHRPKSLRQISLTHYIGSEHLPQTTSAYTGMHTSYVLGEFGETDKSLHNIEGDGCGVAWVTFTEAKRLFNKTKFDEQNLEALEFVLLRC